MEIKKSLKTLDVKFSRLASELGISRPTLDTYIEYFEKGIKIPNEAYQRIFEYLFSTEQMTSIEFAQKYDYVKRVMLSDVKRAVFCGIEEKREQYLACRIAESVSSGKLSTELLEFVFLFINHCDVPLVRAIYMYFNYSNGYKDITEDEPSALDKAFFSQLSLLFEKYRSRCVETDEEGYQRLVQKNQTLREKKKPKVTDDDILRYIRENLGDSGSIDIEKIRKMLNDREGI